MVQEKNRDQGKECSKSRADASVEVHVAQVSNQIGDGRDDTGPKRKRGCVFPRPRLCFGFVFGGQ